MERDSYTLIERLIDSYKNKKIWKMMVGCLSVFIFLLVVILLKNNGVTLNDDGSYTLHLIDSYERGWKTSEAGYITDYDLKLHFVDTLGNSIEGRDLTINVGDDYLGDDPYGFGYVPLEGVKSTTTRGKDLIEEFELYNLVTSNNTKYVFDHAEVYTGGAWRTFSSSGIHWHIYCGNSSSIDKPTTYGWRGQYGEDTGYTINNETQYKFVYKMVMYGNDKTVSSLGADSGIKFKLFNYTGDNDETGINNNGVYDYFTFRDSSLEKSANINSEIDADGFYQSTKVQVESTLDASGYPVFDCQGKCNTNPSLGYLFGASTNPLGGTLVGVEGYTPVNTLLQKETVEGVEYYYYDSNINAVDYDIDNDKFLVRNYVESGQSLSGYKEEASRHEFMPFDYLTNESTTKTNETTGLGYDYNTGDIDHWYGMTMEFEFYMPADGMINGKDMIFSFSGDDDVWVFIDNVLVLDLGGTHGSVDGNINFRTGEVEGYLNWNDVIGTVDDDTAYATSIYKRFTDANSTGSTKWNSDNTTFANYTKHTLKFFYLERGAAVANCKIRFNIPVLPSGSLSVQKKFVGTDYYDTDYEFTLYDVSSGVAQGVANTKYTVGNLEYFTDANGKFTLKTNQEAIFKLTNEHTYYVEETNPGTYADSYMCSFDGEDCDSINKTLEFTMDPESTYQVIFTNKIKTYDLTVRKEVYGESNEKFDFQLDLTRDSKVVSIPMDSDGKYVVNQDSGIVTFSLGSLEDVVIKNIPVGTNIVLRELEHDGYHTIIKSGDVLLANGDMYEFVLNEDRNIVVHNLPGVVLPETGGKGIFGYIIIGSLLLLISIIYKYKYILLKEGGR